MSVNDLDQVLRAGTLLVIETGEYSDRSWCGPVRMLKDASKAQLAEEYRSTWEYDEKRPWTEEPDPDGFLPWLVKVGYAEDVENVTAWHVGSYSRFEP